MNKTLCIFFAIFILAGCAKSDKFSNEPPELTGKIFNGTYYGYVKNPDGKQVNFSFFIPQANKPNEFNEAMVVEEYSDDFTLTMFGPMAYDQSRFGTYIINRFFMPEDFFREELLPYMINKFAEGTGFKMEKIYAADMKFDGHTAIYQVYTQYAPLYIDQYGYEHKHVKRIFGIYFVLYKEYIAMLIVSASSIGSESIVDPDIIIKQKWPAQQEFINSFKLYAK